MSTPQASQAKRRSVTATGPVVVGGHYKLTKPIGTGGTAEVWAAQHTIGQFPCAVKIMHMTRHAFDLCREEFKLLSLVYHPNIVRTFDMGFIDDTDQAYLSMEYISGDSWEELKTKTVSRTDVMGWLKQVVSPQGDQRAAHEGEIRRLIQLNQTTHIINYSNLTSS